MKACCGTDDRDGKNAIDACWDDVKAGTFTCDAQYPPHKPCSESFPKFYEQCHDKYINDPARVAPDTTKIWWKTMYDTCKAAGDDGKG